MATSSKFNTPTESQVENDILMFLSRIKGGYFWKNTSGGFFDGTSFRRQSSPFAIRGTSDILGVFEGRFVCFEVKAKGGKASSHQLAFIKKIQSAGGLGSVVDSVEKVQQCFSEWFGVSSELDFSRASEKEPKD